MEWVWAVIIDRYCKQVPINANLLYPSHDLLIRDNIYVAEQCLYMLMSVTKGTALSVDWTAHLDSVINVAKRAFLASVSSAVVATSSRIITRELAAGVSIYLRREHFVGSLCQNQSVDTPQMLQQFLGAVSYNTKLLTQSECHASRRICECPEI
jgi:hypothetical protein